MTKRKDKTAPKSANAPASVLPDDLTALFHARPQREAKAKDDNDGVNFKLWRATASYKRWRKEGQAGADVLAQMFAKGGFNLDGIIARATYTDSETGKQGFDTRSLVWTAEQREKLVQVLAQTAKLQAAYDAINPKRKRAAKK